MEKLSMFFANINNRILEGKELPLQKFQNYQHTPIYNAKLRFNDEINYLIEEYDQLSGEGTITILYQSFIDAHTVSRTVTTLSSGAIRH